MARYNTVAANTTVSNTATISTPYSGVFVELTGSGSYTVTLPNPVLYAGIKQSYYNSTGATVTLSTPSGVWVGIGSSGSANQSVLTNASITFVSDGTNYAIVSANGGIAGSFTTLTASAGVTLSPASADVVLSPSGTGVVTINPATVGTINNVNIGGSTRGTGAFTTLNANSTVGLSPSNATVTISPSGSGGVTISPSGSGSLTINPTTTGAIDNVNIGATNKGTGAFTTISTTGAASLNSGTVATAPSSSNDITNKTYVDTISTKISGSSFFFGTM